MRTSLQSGETTQLPLQTVCAAAVWCWCWCTVCGAVQVWFEVIGLPSGPVCRCKRSPACWVCRQACAQTGCWCAGVGACRRFADEFHALGLPLNVLVNNAGVHLKVIRTELMGCRRLAHKHRFQRMLLVCSTAMHCQQLSLPQCIECMALLRKGRKCDGHGALATPGHHPVNMGDADREPASVLPLALSHGVCCAAVQAR